MRIVTQEGLDKLKNELDDRKVRLRQEIAQSIKEAKEQGDLSENAEYSEAKHQQNENESRIAELEMQLKEAVVAKTNGSTSEVQVGSIVRARISTMEMDFHIVGSNEANPSEGKISHESPLGRVLLGKKKGAKVSVEAPSGKMEYEILEVK
ncbi:MAG: transcription elongation factor GreA [Candidatus Moranbacteria bacterium]|nr:transcription elongation factor GreA [Candidatus Moranbacteria bacterium]